jgi:hypothetical protein
MLVQHIPRTLPSGQAILSIDLLSHLRYLCRTKPGRIVSSEILWYDKRKLAGNEGASRPRVLVKRVQGWCNWIGNASRTSLLSRWQKVQ